MPSDEFFKEFARPMRWNFDSGHPDPQRIQKGSPGAEGHDPQKPVINRILGNQKDLGGVSKSHWTGYPDAGVGTNILKRLVVSWESPKFEKNNPKILRIHTDEQIEFPKIPRIHAGPRKSEVMNK